MAKMLALGFDCWVENPYYRRKTPLVVGETWTRVLADIIAIAASALNHCANQKIHSMLYVQWRHEHTCTANYKIVLPTARSLEFPRMDMNFSKKHKPTVFSINKLSTSRQLTAWYLKIVFLKTVQFYSINKTIFAATSLW